MGNMRTQIAKWGASCAVRIPKMAVEMLGFHEGQEVTIKIKEHRMIITKARPKYKLADLVKEMEGKEPPELELDDPPMGEELI